jgi:uncharacterized membrane protein
MDNVQERKKIVKLAKLQLLFMLYCLHPVVYYCSFIIQPSSQQILNKETNSIVLIFIYYVHLLYVSIQLEHHKANIHELYYSY